MASSESLDRLFAGIAVLLLFDMLSESMLLHRNIRICLCSFEACLCLFRLYEMWKDEGRSLC